MMKHTYYFIDGPSMGKYGEVESYCKAILSIYYSPSINVLYVSDQPPEEDNIWFRCGVDRYNRVKGKVPKNGKMWDKFSYTGTINTVSSNTPTVMEQLKALLK
jgi:hypothetical protein